MKKQLLNLKKALFGTFLLVLSITQGQAQTPTEVWVSQIGNAKSEYGSQYNGKRIATDADGNVYTTASYYGTTTPAGYFGGTPEITFTPGTSSSINAFYISKSESDGHFTWIKGFAGSGHAYSRAIAVDADKNVYVTGSFAGTINFGGGSVTAGSTGSDIFILKLAADGSFVWVKVFSNTGTLTTETGTGIAVDKSGNILVSGDFESTIDFDPSNDGVASLTSSGDRDVFILKLTAAGDFVWVKQVGGTSADASYAITPDVDNNIYVAGNFTGSNVDFDPGVGSATLSAPSTSVYSGYILKLNSTGDFVWVKQIINTASTVNVLSIAVDAASAPDRKVAVAGYSTGTVNFGNGNVSASGGGADAFVVKLAASDGAYQWARYFGSAASDAGYNVAMDAAGNAYVAGYFRNSMSVNDITLTAPVADKDNSFVIKFSGTDGSAIWGKDYGSSGTNRAVGIEVDGDDNVYITGIGHTTAYGDAGSLTLVDGSWDIFILKINQTTTTPVTLESFNGHATNDGNVLTWITLSELNNSYFELERSTDNVNFIVLKKLDGWGSSTTRRVYSYTDSHPLPGVNYYRLKQVDFDGNFAYAANIVPLTNRIQQRNNAVYPNPSKGKVTIAAKGGFSNASIRIVNVSGQTVLLKDNVSGSFLNADLTNQVDGIYIIEIQQDGTVQKIKVMKN
ncbi:T9SS type A sorting domain-containing protein [Pedobacter sp. BS3]|uniref:SBBP repeat-containing protein n=1 Tax=Pedobacter sp. BS3 TaxID=2567937 RepID=UPI0011ED6560|nr:SBBP repeat-containing protein [Pedobacter sp. BS3]TZF81428.1 T9SS type A sorting domain-containing protein [Pedobacter sp. BS3]